MAGTAMPYLSQFKHDVFISYAHLDNPIARAPKAGLLS
jgi:hypothetical protein